MLLALCPRDDRPARWALDSLRRAGCPVLVVEPSALAATATNGGGGAGAVELPDGTTLDPERCTGVLQRVTTWPSLRLLPAGGRSDVPVPAWVEELGVPVLNRTVVGTAGAWATPSRWTAAAEDAGLAPMPYRTGSGDARREPLPHPPIDAALVRTVWAAGRVTGDAVHPAVEGALARLADAMGFADQLLGVDLLVGPGGHTLFVGADPSPDLRIGGLPLVQRLARLLGGAARRPGAVA